MSEVKKAIAMAALLAAGGEGCATARDADRQVRIDYGEAEGYNPAQVLERAERDGKYKGHTVAADILNQYKIWLPAEFDENNLITIEKILIFLLSRLSEGEWRATIKEKGELFSRLVRWQQFLVGDVRSGVRKVLEEPRGERAGGDLEERIDRLAQTVRAQQARDRLRQKFEDEVKKAESDLKVAGRNKKKTAARKVLQSWGNWRGVEGEVNHTALFLVEQIVDILSTEEVRGFVESNQAFRLWLEDALLKVEAEPLSLDDVEDKGLRVSIQRSEERRTEKIKKLLVLSEGKAAKKK